DLTARGPGKELAEGDKVSVARLVDPPTSDHVFLVEVPQVSDRAAERRQAERGRDAEHLERRPGSAHGRHRATASAADESGSAEVTFDTTHIKRYSPSREWTHAVRRAVGRPWAGGG